MLQVSFGVAVDQGISEEGRLARQPADLLQQGDILTDVRDPCPHDIAVNHGGGPRVRVS
jgi:hypothetical protein